MPEAGTYRIEYAALPPRLWGRSEPIELTRDSVESVDVTVQAGGSLSGTVTAEGDELGAEAFVASYELVDGTWTVFDSALVDRETGEYTLYFAGPEDREIRLGHIDYAFFTYRFWDGTRYGTDTVEQAATIRVTGLARVIEKNLTVRRGTVPLEPIENVEPPVIDGAAVVGRTLTATAGTWSVEAPEVTWQWRRGGVDIDGATGASYTPTAADIGQPITVAAVASAAGHAESESVESAAVGPVVAEPRLSEPHVWVVAVPGERRVRFAVLVWALGVSLTKMNGPLVVTVDGQQVATGTLRNGVALVVASSQPRGRRTYTVAFVGNDEVAAGSRTVAATVR